MARTKKRAADSSAGAPTRPLKKRKSAEAALVRLQEMKDADEEFELEETLHLQDAQGKKQNGITTLPDDEDDVDVPAGCEKWKTTSKLTTGGRINEVAKVSNTSWNYAHTVSIEYREAFRLKPLLVLEGSLKGRHVLVLEPVPTRTNESTSTFPFLELPAEIRSIIYEYVLAESRYIKIDNYKSVHQPRRAVRNTFRPRYCRSRKGQKWDSFRGKWLGQEPSALTVLGVSKGVLQEAAPIIYGNNTFSFGNVLDALTFLSQIGDMREHLRALHFEGIWNYYSHCPYEDLSSIAKLLKAAKKLHTLSFVNGLLCGGLPCNQRPHWSRSMSIGSMYNYLKPLITVLHEAQASGESTASVLDLVKFKGKEECYSCKSTGRGQCAHTNGYIGGCTTLCKDMAKHCDELMKQFGRLIAEDLDIPEDTADDEQVDDQVEEKRRVSEEVSDEPATSDG